jgi:hypothetical protein
MGTARYFQYQQHSLQEGQFAVPRFIFVFNTFWPEHLLSSPEPNLMAPPNLTAKKKL